MVRSLIRVLVIFSLAIASVKGTFLQWALCDDSHGSGYFPYRLNARLGSGKNTTSSKLALDLVHHQNGIPCDNTTGTSEDPLNATSWPQATVQLSWLGLRGRGGLIRNTSMPLGCENFDNDERPMPLLEDSSRVAMILLDEEIEEMPALSTVRMEARIDSPIFDDAQCIASLLTPGVTPATSFGLRYGALAFFAFVSLVSIMRTISAASGVPQREDRPDDYSGSNLPARIPAATPVLPLVYDCIHFLQFIFLSGGLSLSFPGFYPAVTSHLNGFALFANWALPIRSLSNIISSAPWTPALTYPGVQDGLYEVNGTYGGYPGMEVMTQMLGAPMTCDNWVLMLLLTAGIAVILGLFLWLLEVVRPRNVLGLPLLDCHAENRQGRSARISNGVLRLLLSYMTMPLVAMSAYQVNLYGVFNLGGGYISVAIIFSVSIILGFAWLAVRLPPASLGALVFEGNHEYQHVGESGLNDADESREEGRRARRQHAFVMILFVLNILRGLVIGGLQNWGLVQLVLLMACEIIMLLAIRYWRSSFTVSCDLAATLLRLAILACFVPSTLAPSRHLELKSVLAYVALLLSLMGAIGVFFLPSCWHLYRIFAEHYPGCSFGNDAPPVFNLRQLRRRQPRGSRCLASPGLTPTLSPSAAAHREGGMASSDVRNEETSASYFPAYNTHDPAQNSLHDGYYRQSRSPNPTLPGERSRSDTRATSSRSSSIVSTRPVSPADALSSQSTHLSPWSMPDGHHAVSTLDETLSNSPSITGDTENTTRPLGPRWNDYSFREADLFFATAPPPGATVIRRRSFNSPAASHGPQIKWWNQLALPNWWSANRRITAEPVGTGFSVVRPARVRPQPSLEQ